MNFLKKFFHKSPKIVRELSPREKCLLAYLIDKHANQNMLIYNESYEEMINKAYERMCKIKEIKYDMFVANLTKSLLVSMPKDEAINYCNMVHNEEIKNIFYKIIGVEKN